MLRAIRVLAVAAIIAASLAIGGSTASADTTPAKVNPNAPHHAAAITWE